MQSQLILALGVLICVLLTLSETASFSLDSSFENKEKLKKTLAMKQEKTKEAEQIAARKRNQDNLQ